MARSLFLPGAALSCATTAGMLAFLERSNFATQVDYLVGTSAGAMSAVYFLGGAAVRGAAGYWNALPQYIHTNGFYSALRIFSGRPFVDLRDVHTHIFENSNPIPYEDAVANPLNNSGRFIVQVFDCDAGELRYLTRFRTARALKSAILGTCWLPVLAGFEPYTLTSAELSEMEVLDHHFSPLPQSRLRVFDGSLADYYMTNARHALNTAQCTYLLPEELTLPFKSPKFSNWPIHLSGFAMHLLMRRYPLVTSAYARHIIAGGIKRDAAEIVCLAETAKWQLIKPVPNISLGRTNPTSLELRAAVEAGWDGASWEVERKTTPYPIEW
jgi:hypothetical protein